MISLRQREERGRTRIDWLDSYHTFSFGDYYDPHYMGYSDLRVINDDRVEPSQGFGTHGHRDMEIITYVLEGTLAHKDSLGNGSLIQAGEVQRMSAGTGIRHSEFNPSDTEPVHFLQIWILPQAEGLQPGYEQKKFDREQSKGRWQLNVSPDGRDGSLSIQQDTFLWSAILETEQTLDYTPASVRSAWLQLASGVVQVNDRLLEAGDGLAVTGEPIRIEGITQQSEVLLFDLRKDGSAH
jgi:redox-sensitive bicupin YhaK (pirin superfamily)